MFPFATAGSWKLHKEAVVFPSAVFVCIDFRFFLVWVFRLSLYRPVVYSRFSLNSFCFSKDLTFHSLLANIFITFASYLIIPPNYLILYSTLK